MFLEIKGLTKRFGGLTAVDQFDMYVNKREDLVGLIGPNGAGKSTIFNLITGVFPKTSGQVIFDGKDISNKRPHEVAELGIGRTFQLNPLFGDYTVLQNLSASFYLHPRTSMLDILFNTLTYRRNEAYIQEQSLEILQLLGLEEIKNELAKNLPHGYQKLLGMARALAVRPKLLLLDEPLSGMNPRETDFCIDAIRKIHEQEVAVLVVEHNMKILDICDRVIVISFGQKICAGSPQEVRNNKEVISAYLGSEHHA